MSDPYEIFITPSFRGAATGPDLLFAEGTMAFVTNWSSLLTPGTLFLVRSPGFVFSLSSADGSIVFQRNEAALIFPVGALSRAETKVRMALSWSPTALIIDAGTDVANRQRLELTTAPCATPVDLIRWARKQGLVPRQEYETEEALRQRVYQALLSVNDKIHEADAYRSFWNIVYSGNTISDRQPKEGKWTYSR